MRMSRPKWRLGKISSTPLNGYAFDGRLFQVLSLPRAPVRAPVRLLGSPEEMAERDPATIHQIIRDALR